MIGATLVLVMMTQGAVFTQGAHGPISMATPKVALTFKQVSKHSLPDVWASNIFQIDVSDAHAFMPT